MTNKLPRQRWKFYHTQPQIVADIVKRFGISSIMAQVIANRGIDNLNEAQAYISPETIDLPHSIQLLKDAIAPYGFNYPLIMAENST